MDRHEQAAPDCFDVAARKWWEQHFEGNPGLGESVLATHFRTLCKLPDEPKGRCGECECVTNLETVGKPEIFCIYKGRWLPSDMTCPRFAPREDKAAMLAREFCEGKLSHWAECERTRTKEKLADFLRANGVEGE
jgi:hypothetical protein